MNKSKIYCFSLFVSAVLTLGLAELAQAQIPVHGVTIAKGCQDSKATDTTDCVIQVGYNDDYGDTITIQEAYDRVDPLGDDVRVPAAGNLPIDEVFGNTTCTVGGALPCNIGPAGSTLDGLPGLPDDGVVTFRQDTYVIQNDDPDPLLDQATVVVQDQCDDPSTQGCSTIPNTVNFGAATNLFQPCIDLTKTSPDDFSKVGDDVQYQVSIDNCSSDDSPDLIFDAITDDLQGDLTNPANYDASDCPVVGGTLAPGDSCTIAYTRTVQAADPDPLVNTATVETHPDGFPNDVDDSDSHTVDLFEPCIDLVKTGPDISKVGDDVTYTVDITNCGETGIPDLIFDGVSDSLQGDLCTPANYDTNTCPCDGSPFASGDSCTIIYTRTVQAGDTDPLVNTATVETHPDGFPNDVDDSDDHTVNLFQPCIDLTKTGPDASKVGDDVQYVVSIDNCSSMDSPGLIFDNVTDTLQGNLCDPANYDANDCPCDGSPFASGDSCTIVYTRTVQAGDPDPLLNVACVESHPAEFLNDVDDCDDHEVDLFVPCIDLVKTSPDDFSKVGDDVTYTVDITNCGEMGIPDLIFDGVSDSLQGDLCDAANVDSNDCPCDGSPFASGDSCTIVYTRTVQMGDADPLVNTATVETHPDGFPNDVDDSDSHTVDLFQPCIDLVKSGPDVSKVGDDVTYTVDITNCGETGIPDLIFDAVTDSLQGDLCDAANVDSNDCPCDGSPFASGDSCTIVYTRTVQAADPDPLVNTATVETHPDGFPNDVDDSDDHTVDLFQPCVDLTKECSPDPVQAGDPLMYTVVIDNCSSMDSPPLIIDAITDNMQGDLTVNFDASDCPDVGGSLAAGASCTITYSFTVDNCDVNPIDNTASVETHPEGFPNDVDDSDTASCGCEAGGGEGCTPGYWKLIDDDPAEASHQCYWEDPYDPYDLFSATCANGVCFEDAFPGKTLIQVLDQDVDAIPQLRSLGFHTVAALLNAASPYVNYGVATPQEVIEMFNAAYPGSKGDYVALKSIFAGYNEAEYGCPLNNCKDFGDSTPPFQAVGTGGGTTTRTESSVSTIRACGAAGTASLAMALVGLIGLRFFRGRRE